MASDLFSQQLLANVQELRAQNHALSRVVGGLQQKTAELTGIESVLKNLKMTRSGGLSGADGSSADSVPGARNAPMMKMPNGMGYQSLDQIVGRQIVYDLICTIPVIDGQPGPVRNTMYVTPDGPFCAVARYMTFMSSHSVQVTTSAGTSAFYSRSNGRFRPVSSSSDIMDAVRAFEQANQYQPAYLGTAVVGGAALAVANPIGVNPNSTDVTNMLPNWPGNGRPIYASPLSMAAQRTMSFDGLVSIETRASATRRQEQPVPSTFWTDRDGGMVALPTIDVFEPGEIIDVVVEPTHPNNPAYGNIQNLFYFNTGAGYDDYDSATGIAANNPAPVGQFPSLAGQFDGHEGTDAASLPRATANTKDPASRNATGYLTVGYIGYRILQGPSAQR
jgi:phosphoribosyl-AMP cyclohydrolase